MKRKVVFSLLLAGFILAGCQQQSNDLKIKTQTLPSGQNQQTSLTSPPPTNPQATANPRQQKGGMKTLQDFEKIDATQATIMTNKGAITFELYRDKAPLTTANFLNLVKEGFYNGIVFHRVIPDFMAQVGDPLTKDPTKQGMWGSGGPGYTIADEFGEGLAHDSEGMVSMANAGPNTGGSQFFITYAATPWLDGKHAIFGKVTAGMDVLKSLENGDTITEITYK
ncbi:MAG TPA: peptidylprolyl isomerase [Vitreimonas sp.]|nr:peptidylprolyl isomerase [Vitreimonas sp.]